MKFLKVAVTVLYFISFLFAQEQSDELVIHGKVVSVDLPAKMVVVKTEHTQDTLVIKSGAKIMLGLMELSKEITLDDLFTGSTVTVTWALIKGKKNAVKIVKESAFDAPEQIR